jgi:hypothetical protein
MRKCSARSFVSLAVALHLRDAFGQSFRGGQRTITGRPRHVWPARKVRACLHALACRMHGDDNEWRPAWRTWSCPSVRSDRSSTVWKMGMCLPLALEPPWRWRLTWEAAGQRQTGRRWMAGRSCQRLVHPGTLSCVKGWYHQASRRERTSRHWVIAHLAHLRVSNLPLGQSRDELEIPKRQCYFGSQLRESLFGTITGEKMQADS